MNSKPARNMGTEMTDIRSCLAGILETKEPQSLGKAPYDLAAFVCVLDEKEPRLAADRAHLQYYGAEDLINNPTKDDFGQQVGKVFTSWQSPSLLAIVNLAAELFDLDSASAMTKAAYAGAVLGEIKNDQYFHGNEHYRKVVMQLMALIKEHNIIHGDGDLVFSKEDIAQLLAAACIHDIDHDGQGNGKGDAHIQYRLERRSYYTAAPYLKACGLSDQQLQEILVMLLCTDVSSPQPGDVPSPVDRMVVHYECLISEVCEPPELLEDMMVLKDNEKLTVKAALLHTADITISAGLSYERLKEESELLKEETGLDMIGTPAGYKFFMSAIGKNILLTDAGRALYESSYNSIIEQIEADLSYSV